MQTEVRAKKRRRLEDSNLNEPDRSLNSRPNPAGAFSVIAEGHLLTESADTTTNLKHDYDPNNDLDLGDLEELEEFPDSETERPWWMFWKAFLPRTNICKARKLKGQKIVNAGGNYLRHPWPNIRQDIEGENGWFPWDAEYRYINGKLKVVSRRDMAKK